jgi:Domain of unknown function (DUF4390)
MGSAILLVGFLSTTDVNADENTPPQKRVCGVTQADARLLVSFSYLDVFTTKVKKQLSSGLPTRAIIEINLEKEGTETPLAYWVRSTQIVYDLWEERYLVTVEDNNGRRRASARTAAESIKLAGTLRKEKIVKLAGLPPGNYRLRIHIEVNPVSKEMVENIRRWLARPPTGKSGTMNQTSFFGSFVGKFVDHRIGKADHTLSFVSQWFRVPKQ